MPTRWLFLDDTRNPPGHLFKVFDVVRNYDEFVDYIETYGVPELISFDHDLSPEHTMFFFERGGWKNPPDPIHEIFKDKTGYDCAKWLIEYCQSSGHIIKNINIHSRNPQGTKNIYELFDREGFKINKNLNLKTIRWKELERT